MIAFGSKWDLAGRKLEAGEIGVGGVRAFNYLGTFALKVMRDRVGRGIGSDDKRMPPLTRAGQADPKHGGRRRYYGWADSKRRAGLDAMRDLWGKGDRGGHLLEEPTVRSVTDRSVVMAITTRMGRIKAYANEKIYPWFGWSPRDLEQIIRKAHELFSASIADAGVVFRGFRSRKGFGSRAKWLT